ncbi:hypothetical protein [Nocardioides pantholopis]|uniref:hypothetical protein n=1 Tax=Nocardioides pantholopis TaxID=2483798 RepID=UPI000FDA1DE6|nr:hypothetical protein [Nocardioides pantholopis]
MSSTPVTAADVGRVRDVPGAPATTPRVRQQARERLALMAFSAATSGLLALVLLALFRLGS